MTAAKIGFLTMGAAGLVTAALAADCFVNVEVNCCALSTYQPFCQNCTYHPNCCDVLSSDEQATHHVPATAGQPGKKKTTTGPSCICKIQQKTCSQGGYCVDQGNPIDQSITPNPIDSTSDPCSGEI